MNKVMLMGRLTKNPEIRISGNENNTAVARYTLAVDRRYKKDGERTADFITCIVFGKGTDFVQKYLHKGMKIAVVGRLHTGSYKNKDGNTVYTTDVIVDEHEFAGGKSGDDTAEKETEQAAGQDKDGFMQVSEGEELPFN
ncbi:MAG: single-stranded DNA-binding protein [Lachnospiraceae bacterium]|nr:single-stranded DNA-binding protein [Lachnospiraceae bacterium]